MFALDPRKHHENTNKREADDIFITFGKRGRKSSNLHPEPIKQVGDGSIGNRKILTTCPKRSHQLLCITPKLSQFLAQQILKSLRLLALCLLQIRFFLHDGSMRSPQIIEIFVEAIKVGGQSSLTTFNLSHLSMGGCAQPRVSFLELCNAQTLLNLRRFRSHLSLHNL
jgi:hypothetical protein